MAYLYSTVFFHETSFEPHTSFIVSGLRVNLIKPARLTS